MTSSSTAQNSAQPTAAPVGLRMFLRRLAPISLRLIVGYGFMAHGFAKLSRGPDTFAVVLHTLGIPMPSLLAWLTTLVEFIGGFSCLDRCLRADRKLAHGSCAADSAVHYPFAVWLLLREARAGQRKRYEVRSSRIRDHPALSCRPDYARSWRLGSIFDRSLAFA